MITGDNQVLKSINLHSSYVRECDIILKFFNKKNSQKM